MLHFEAHVQSAALTSYLLLETVIVLKLAKKTKVGGGGGGGGTTIFRVYKVGAQNLKYFKGRNHKHE